MVHKLRVANAKQKLQPISSDLKLYCARHTFATDMLAEGLNVVEVKDLTSATTECSAKATSAKATRSPLARRTVRRIRNESA
jgi:site-specific recombinase XerD